MLFTLTVVIKSTGINYNYFKIDLAIKSNQHLICLTNSIHANAKKLIDAIEIK